MRPLAASSAMGHIRRMMIRAPLLLLLLALAGCAVVAAPFRVTADVVRIVPVAGDIVAAPLDVTGDVID